MNKVIITSSCIFALACADAMVYDDAKAVYVGNGGGEIGANVRPTTCTWRDLRHATDPMASTHANMTTCGVTPNYAAAYDNTIVYAKSDVNCLSSGVTLRDEPVLKFNHKFRKDGDVRYHTPNILNLGWTFPKNEYTILMRFKPEEPIGMTSLDAASDNSGVALFSVQGTWQKSGFNFGYRPNAEGTGGNLKVFGYGAVHSGNAAGIRALTVTNEVWHELAVTVKDKIMTVSLAADPEGLGKTKRQTVTKDWSPHTSLDWFTPEEGKTLVVGGSANTIAEKSDMTGNSFRGLIHMMAFWDRVLTQDEINEAFSQGRPAVMRVGFGENVSGGDLFAGTPGASVELASAQPWAWSAFPSAWTAGTSVTIPFAIPERDAGLGQMLRLVGDLASGEGRVAVSLDGDVLREIGIGSGSREFFIPGTALSSGGHTLVLRRSDNGSSAVNVRSISLEGSWCYRPVSGSPASAVHNVTPVTDCYPGSVRNTLNQGESNSQSFSFNLTESMISTRKMEYHVKLLSSRALMKSHIRITVNDTPFSYEDVPYNGEIVLRIPPKALKVGTNIVKVSCFDTETNWPSFDTFKMEVVGEYKGLCVILK